MQIRLLYAVQGNYLFVILGYKNEIDLTYIASADRAHLYITALFRH